MSDRFFQPYENREEISEQSLGSHPMVGFAELQEILRRTGVELTEAICQRKFLHILNTEIDRTIREQLEERLDPRKVEMARSSYRRFMQLTRKLEVSEFPPPEVSRLWEKNYEDWLQNVTRFLERRSTGGPREMVLAAYFYPRAMGLLFAGTGIVPTDKVSWDVDAADYVDGAAARFLFQVTTRVRKCIEMRGLDGNLHDLSAVKVIWDDPKDEAFSARLEKALKQECEFEEHLPARKINLKTHEVVPEIRRGQDKTWRVIGEQFRSEIQRCCADEELTKLNYSS